MELCSNKCTGCVNFVLSPDGDESATATQMNPAGACGNCLFFCELGDIVVEHYGGRNDGYRRADDPCYRSRKCPDLIPDAVTSPLHVHQVQQAVSGLDGVAEIGKYDHSRQGLAALKQEQGAAERLRDEGMEAADRDYARAMMEALARRDLDKEAAQQRHASSVQALEAKRDQLAAWAKRQTARRMIEQENENTATGTSRRAQEGLAGGHRLRPRRFIRAAEWQPDSYEMRYEGVYN